MSDYNIKFDGRVAVITGAGGGLGRVYALELAKRGGKIVINDFGGSRDGASDGSSSPADLVVEEIKKNGGEAVANYDNVATPEGGENIIKTALDAFGKVDIVVNNAGILRDKSFLKIDPDTWNSVVNVHLYGAYNVSRPAFKVMKENGYGRIVMTTSAAGLYGNFGQANYAAAKAGLVGMMNVLKLEGAKNNIKVNTIAPTAASRLTEDILTPEQFKLLKPEFVSPMVVYLCSEQCRESGAIYLAGMGLYNRAMIMNSKPVSVGDGKIPTAEDIFAKLDQINDMKDADFYNDIPAYLAQLMKTIG